MINLKDSVTKILLLAGLITQTVAAATPTPQELFLSRISPQNATILLELGGFNTSQGHAQNIGIQDLIGDRFTVSHSHASNYLLGAGYYVDGINQNPFTVLFGLNAFYFPGTTVKGTVIQENLFANLSYRYNLSNFPIYVATKAIVKTKNDKYDITFDLGVGPNIMQTSYFREYSLDGGVTLPDNAFSGRTNVALSATAGIGIKFNNLISHVPCELSYRFFYLGQSNLNTNNTQILNALKTGDNVANAIMFTAYL